MGSKTVIWVGYPAQIMLQYAVAADSSRGFTSVAYIYYALRILSSIRILCLAHFILNEDYFSFKFIFLYHGGDIIF